MKTRYIFIFALALIGFYACDKIESDENGSFLENKTDSINTSVKLPDSAKLIMPADTIIDQKVLIEDFTGHRCTNCPDGHRKIHDLQIAYPGKVIPVAIHYGIYTELNTEFTYDFTTTMGNAVGDFFAPTGFPNATLNRLPKSDGITYTWSRSNWASVVDTLVDNKTNAIVKITNLFNSTTNELNCFVQTGFTKNYTEPLSLVVYLLEDNIIKPQIDGGSTIEDYEHNHVLRASLTGDMYGKQVIGVKDSVVTNQFTFSNFKDKAGNNLNIDNCSIVAFLVDKATNHIVVQVEQAKVK